MELRLVQSSAFAGKCRLIKDSHFTRKRKMPLSNLILSVLSRKGVTMVMEIRAFFRSVGSKGTISKAGYLKQRQKLNPEVFHDLSKYRATNFYKDASMVRRWRGFLILAADGSSANIPTTKENLKIYGNASRKNTKPRAQLGISCLFDVMNKMVIGCSINKWKFNEREQALVHLDACDDITGGKSRITIFDRGYPSGEFFLDLMERGEKFLVRLGSVDFKREQESMQTADEDVRVVFTKERINPHRGTPTGKRLEEAGEIFLRFVRIQLESGELEFLATNLEDEYFNTADIGILYSMRWGIETAYDTLKNKLSLENFSGTKPILIEQDIYATIYLCNIMHDMLLDAQLELDRRQEFRSKKYKHVMEVNRNIAIGRIKEDIIAFALEKDLHKRGALFEGVLQEISRNIIPVRKDRSYPRAQGKMAGKHSNTTKRSY
jgi:hypothetical protein